tara:strand:- start:8057 stop:8755 length:699 start_codon:yes stop_codon:yes gene_type:complete
LTTRNVYGLLDPKCPLCRAPPVNLDGSPFYAHQNRDQRWWQGAGAQNIAGAIANHVAINSVPHVPQPRRCGICRQEGHTRRQCPQSTPEIVEQQANHRRIVAQRRSIRMAVAQGHGPLTQQETAIHTPQRVATFTAIGLRQNQLDQQNADYQAWANQQNLLLAQGGGIRGAPAMPVDPTPAHTTARGHRSFNRDRNTTIADVDQQLEHIQQLIARMGEDNTHVQMLIGALAD